MKILLMDSGNIADALTQVLCREGHDVYASNDHVGTRLRGAKTIGYYEDMRNAINERWDLVVACGTNVNRDGHVEMFKDKGIPVVGSGAKGFQMEKKNVGRKIFEEAGFTSPPWSAFDHVADAIRFLKSFHASYGVVVKFTETNRAFRTIVCENPDDAITGLERAGDGQVVIEGKVQGNEVSHAVYFDGHRFVQAVTTMEHKHLWRGRRGVLTPEMGTLVWYEPAHKWVEAFNSLLESPTAREHLKDYRGFLDINAIVDEDGEIVPLEFTCRYGVPQTDIMTALQKTEGDYGEFLLSVANGDSRPDLLHHRAEFAVGVNLVVCGFPYHEIHPDICQIGSPIRGLQDIDTHFTLGAVKEVGSQICTDGAWVMCVTGIGFDVPTARQRAYENEAKVSFHDMIFRDDIGESFENEKRELAAKDIISWRLAYR